MSYLAILSTVASQKVPHCALSETSKSGSSLHILNGKCVLETQLGNAPFQDAARPAVRDYPMSRVVSHGQYCLCQA